MGSRVHVQTCACLVVCARVWVTGHKYASTYMRGPALCMCEGNGESSCVYGSKEGAGASLYQTGSREAKGTPAAALSQLPI